MMFKKILLSLLALGIFSAVLYGVMRSSATKEAGYEPIRTSPTSQTPAPTETPKDSEKTESTKTQLPKKFILEVPFTPQAPTANWDELHNEACEEASVLMANAFLNGDTRNTLPPEETEKEIEKLTKWQQEKLGYYLSIDSEETVRMTESVYGLKAEVIRDFSEETIKTALTQNKVVLVPVNGRLLGNPYFQQPGPIYHMFIIKGYDEKSFIVNEPGTKRGRDYRYTYETIKNAIGDYDHDKKETVPSKPAIIIVSK